MKKSTCLACTLTLFLLSLITQAQDFKWAYQAGGISFDVVKASAVDADGNVYITGNFSDVVDFDPGAGVSQLTAFGNQDVFVAKLDSNGTLVWARQIGGTSYEDSYAIVVDNIGSVYVSGYFAGTIDADPGAGTLNFTSAGNNDAFVVKLDGAGFLLWARQLGDVSNEDATGLGLDPLGNIVIGGNFYGSMDADPGVGTHVLNSAGDVDAYVCKLDASGNFMWAVNMGGVDEEELTGLTVDGNGSIYSTGIFNGTADFDPGAGTLNLSAASAGYSDIFISRLDENGNFIWAGKIGGTDIDYGTDIAVDKDLNMLLTGYFYGTANFDPNGSATMTANGPDDAYVLKLDSMGTYQWAVQIGGTGNDAGYAIAADKYGRVYATGAFNGTVDFDPGPAVHNLTWYGGSWDAYVSKFDQAGNYVWAFQLGSAQQDRGFSVNAGTDGNIYVGGEFMDIGNFDPVGGSSMLTSAGQNDGYIARYHQVCIPTFSTMATTACDSYVSPSGLYTWTASGNYNDTIPNADGCDSVITVNLTIQSVDTSITQSGTLLTSNASGATWQWLDCSLGYGAVPGATTSSYTTVMNGSFAVEVTQGGCVDTSYCYLITSCSGHYTIFPDTIPHVWTAINQATGVPPLTYTWYWGDSTTDTIAAPTHVYAGPAFYNICLEVTDSNGCTDMYCDSSTYIFRMTQAMTMATVNVIMAGPVGIQPLEMEMLSVYPNPADDRLLIRWKNAGDFSDYSVQVFNALGQTTAVPVIWSGDETELRIAALSPGMYFLEMKSPQGRKVMRFIRK